MKSLVSIFNFLSNKYLLTGVLFIVWISFFDDRDLITNYKQRQELWKLEQSKKHYSQLVEETKVELHKIQTEPAQLEKFAREKFRMKKDNEDLYIIPE
jgi:cell division protein FtsB